MKKTVLIIGGEGYIGSVLSSKLIGNGYNVKSMDLLIYNNHSCVINNYENSQYEFIYGDMANKLALEKALDGVDYVILLAGLVGDPITKKYPRAAKIINDHGVKNVIDICKTSKIKRLIFVSTCSNYGLIKNDELADEKHELKPLSLYAQSKVAIEKYILSLKDNVKYHPTILRFSTAFGLSPRMRFDLTISEFTREIFLGKKLLVFDADTWRPYCHTQDFARLIQKVIEAPKEKISFEVFNAGGNINNYTKQMIVDEILKLVPNGKVRYQKRGSDPRNYKVNFTKVRSVLDFEPNYTVPDGIEELICAMDKHLFDLVDMNNNFYRNHSINYPVKD